MEEKIESTIITICDYVDKEIANGCSEETLSNMIEALAELVSARANLI